jgi:signal transduction histidine kinase
LERARAQESAELESMAMAQLLRSQYEEIISNTHQSLQWLATYPEIASMDGAACNDRLQQVFATTGYFLALSVSDPQGVVQCAVRSAGETGTTTIVGQPFFQQVIKEKAFAVGAVQVDEPSGEPGLTLAYPMLDDAGTVQGVIGAELNLNLLTRRFSSNPFYQYVALVLLDRNGTVVLRYPDPGSFVGQNVGESELYQAARRGGEAWIQTPGLSGHERLFAYTPVGKPDAPDLYALAGLTTEFIFSGVNRMLRLSLAGLTVIGLAALVSAWLSAEWMIVRRTQRVVQAARRMAAGDLSARVGPLGDSSEMGQLAETFDTMAVALQERDAENARLIAQMQELNAQLESRVIKRTEQLQISNRRLLQTQTELRRLSEQLMQSIEQERTRISREIHDQLGQLMTAIKMELRTIERALERDPEKARERLEETFGLADETIKTIRRIAADLRPGILDDFGLQAALEWQLQQFSARTGIASNLDAEFDEQQLSREMSTAAFRILQEALTNVVRHAEASSIDVLASIEDSSFVLTVQDDGKGLAVDPERRSLGVVGMRERARQLGGSVSVSGAPGQGVRVQLKIPLIQYGVELPPSV